TVQGATERRAAPAGAATIAELESPPLREILVKLNKPSDNLIAEMLLKGIGAEKRAQGTAAAGLAEGRAFWQQAGGDGERVLPQDGSGLSRRNLTTPRSIATLLTYVREQPFFADFYASLPIAGVDGTLRRRMTESPAKEKVHAKTGSLAMSP